MDQTSVTSKTLAAPVLTVSLASLFFCYVLFIFTCHCVTSKITGKQSLYFLICFSIPPSGKTWPITVLHQPTQNTISADTAGSDTCSVAACCTETSNSPACVLTSLNKVKINLSQCIFRSILQVHVKAELSQPRVSSVESSSGTELKEGTINLNGPCYCLMWGTVKSNNPSKIL